MRFSEVQLILQILLPERDYVTIANPSVVCLSVTFVHPTQLTGLNFSTIFLHRCVPLPSSDLRTKFYGDRPRRTPPSGALNATDAANRAGLEFGPVEGYISRMVQDTVSSTINGKWHMKWHTRNSLV